MPLNFQYYFIREVMKNEIMDLKKTHTKKNITNILTKPVNTNKYYI